MKEYAWLGQVGKMLPVFGLVLLALACGPTPEKQAQVDLEVGRYNEFLHFAEYSAGRALYPEDSDPKLEEQEKKTFISSYTTLSQQYAKLKADPVVLSRYRIGSYRYFGDVPYEQLGLKKEELHYFEPIGSPAVKNPMGN